jgi:hypothetical protein
LIIADFGFAFQIHRDKSSLNFSSGTNEFYLQKERLVGSEDYNSPEIVCEEITNDMINGRE